MKYFCKQCKNKANVIYFQRDTRKWLCASCFYGKELEFKQKVKLDFKALKKLPMGSQRCG